MAMGLAYMFTTDELKELYGDKWREALKKKNEQKAKGLRALGDVESTTQLPQGKTPKSNEKSSQYLDEKPETKQLLMKYPRKKLFNGEQDRTRNKSKMKTSQARVLKRRSQSLLNMSDVENDINFKFKKPFNILEDETKIKESYSTEENLKRRISTEEKEFLELEETLKIKRSKKDLLNEINTIIADDHLEFIALKEKFDAFSEKHENNMKDISRILSSYDSTSNIQMSSKKKVTFTENTQVKIDIPEDRGLQKAVNMYNSIRKEHAQFLSTPHLNRESLQTPKSSKRQEGLSRKLQKQCLLLLDTPKI